MKNGIPIHSATGRVILRANWGSYREVEAVLSYTPHLSAVVVWRGEPEAEQVVLGELEAIDSSPERRFVNLDAVLRQRTLRLAPDAAVMMDSEDMLTEKKKDDLLEEATTGAALNRANAARSHIEGSRVSDTGAQ